MKKTSFYQFKIFAGHVESSKKGIFIFICTEINAPINSSISNTAVCCINVMSVANALVMLWGC